MQRTKLKPFISVHPSVHSSRSFLEPHKKKSRGEEHLNLPARAGCRRAKTFCSRACTWSSQRSRSHTVQHIVTYCDAPPKKRTYPSGYWKASRNGAGQGGPCRRTWPASARACGRRAGSGEEKEGQPKKKKKQGAARGMDGAGWKNAPRERERGDGRGCGVAPGSSLSLSLSLPLLTVSSPGAGRWWTPSSFDF